MVVLGKVSTASFDYKTDDTYLCISTFVCPVVDTTFRSLIRLIFLHCSWGFLNFSSPKLLTPPRISSRAPVSWANHCFSPNSSFFVLLPVRPTEPFLLEGSGYGQVTGVVMIAIKSYHEDGEKEVY
jgi:hypothetical protein